MAEIGIIEKFHAWHGSNSHDHNFKIELVLQGKLDSKTGFVEGIDHHKVIAELRKIISTIENKDLRTILLDKGFTSSSNESIATHFLLSLKNKFPIKYVKIWETENRYAVIFSNEIPENFKRI